jgi:ribosomal protein L37E
MSGVRDSSHETVGDLICHRCGWLTFAFERFCRVCGWDRWDRSHIQTPAKWSEVTGR